MPVLENPVRVCFDKILVATDFSQESEKALAYASALALQYASRITLAHVIDASVATHSETADTPQLLDDETRHDCTQMERALDNLGMGGITAQGRTLKSNYPTEALVKLSQQIHPDLIVVGSHHRHGLSKIIHGSFSDGVIRNADCPVMIIGPRVSPASLDMEFRSIVFATDLQHDAAEKAAIALSFAKDSIANIHICHVIESQVESFADAFRQHARAECALSKLLPDTSCIWHTPKPSVLFGNVDHEILKVAKSAQADLIVLGAHRGATWLNRFWDTVVEQIVGQANCPVVTICTN